MKNSVLVLSLVALLFSCSSNEDSNENVNNSDDDINQNVDFDLLANIFEINFDTPPNYEDQPIPNYINQDNTPNNNQIRDESAVLGQILFYDSNLSSNNTTSCASCHKQTFAFGDDNLVSQGANGQTGRHSMRLINARFGNEDRFFWDERANSLEDQTTMPIQDHLEMGFSGIDNDPDFNDLITKLENIDYYPELFTYAFGDPQITEVRMQNALSQFIRSIQSFDSKYDAGRSQVGNENQPFPNFTEQENNGKMLYMQNANFNNQGVRINGGVNCNQCHGAPEFSISQNRDNNGVLGIIGSTALDLTVTRSPSLRDLVNNNGLSNGPFFHDGSATTIAAVIEHYNNGVQNNNNLDNRLRPQGNVQNLNMTAQEIADLVAFMETLTGTNVYIDSRWSNPFLNQ